MGASPAAEIDKNELHPLLVQALESAGLGGYAIYLRKLEMSTSVKCSERILGLTGERGIGSLSVANSKRRGGVGGGTCCATSARCTPAAGGAAAGATTDGGTAATAARVRASCKVGCTSATRDGPKAGDASWPGLYAIVAARVCMPGGSAAPLDWPRYWDICMSSDGSARRSGWEYM